MITMDSRSCASGSAVSAGHLATQHLLHRTRSLVTPFLALDPEEVRRNLTTLRAAFPGIDLFFAVKCNPHPIVVEEVRRAGVGIELASPAEALQLREARFPLDQVMCLHPVKSPAFLQQLAELGIDWLAVDGVEELEKVAQYAPGRRVLARVEVSNLGSRHPLSGKFGCEPREALDLLRRATRLGLRPAGVTTHVGSQCECLATWRAALQVVGELCHTAFAEGIALERISLGGGIPAEYVPGGTSASQVGALVSDHVARQFDPRWGSVTIEPGRAVVASAGTLVATVTGLRCRGDLWIAHLDAGIFHGLMEALPAAGGFTYPVETAHPERPRRVYRLAGPTCDGMDIFPTTLSLPELQVGDRVAFRMAGAYSSTLSSAFNGFPVPTEVNQAALALTLEGFPHVAL